MFMVFDLDGTLVDSAQDLATAASALVQELGAAPIALAKVMTMVGDGAAVLVKRALAHAGLDPETPGALARFVEIYDGCLLDTTVAYAGMVSSLALATERGPMAVLTNKPLAPTERILAALGLRGFFVEVVGGDGPLGRKPDPGGLLTLMARWGTPAVLIGDSPADAGAAAAAPCPFGQARYGFGAVQFAVTAAPRFAMDHPRELGRMLDEIAAASAAGRA